MANAWPIQGEYSGTMLYKIIILATILSMTTNVANGQLGAIRDFVQYNIAGLPVIHQTVSYKFDPDISLKRRKLWEETNGIQGEKLIERLGLGIDGNEDVRLAKQRARDEGHLGGLNYFRP